MAYLYRHIRADKDEPFYVGIGSDDVFKRAYEKNNRNRHWRNIVKNTPYNVEIIVEGLTWKEACEKEKEFVSLYGRTDLGSGSLCNLTEGGEGTVGMKHTDETKKKISQDNKRPEKLAICMENLKKMQTPEARAKALANRDYKEITRKRLLKTDYIKIREASEKVIFQYDLQGNFIKEWKSATEAVNSLGGKLKNSNISKCCDGQRNHCGGFIWRHVIDNKLSEIIPIFSNKKIIIQYDSNMNYIDEFESIRDASRKSSIARANITSCCNEKTKHAGGYIWKFKLNNITN